MQIVGNGTFDRVAQQINQSNSGADGVYPLWNAFMLMPLGIVRRGLERQCAFTLKKPPLPCEAPLEGQRITEKIGLFDRRRHSLAM